MSPITHPHARIMTATHTQSMNTIRVAQRWKSNNGVRDPPGATQMGNDHSGLTSGNQIVSYKGAHWLFTRKPSRRPKGEMEM